ncbi:MAG: GGDEF domain-containing protein [bacterium]|nr:GGDEF domain-containing protein [bacterium]
MEIKRHTDEFLMVKDPQSLATDLMAGKNLWLTKIRWIYTLFIFAFFLVYNYLSGEVSLNANDLGMILALSVLGNVIFTLALKRGQKFPSEKYDHSLYTTLAILQLDFDLVVLSLIIYFSGGFESPMRILFVFYVVISTFLIQHKKAFRNTITASALMTVLFLTDKGLDLSTGKLAALVAFNIILLFAFFISAYLSKNIRENEDKIQELLKRTKELSVTDGLTGLYNQTHFFLLLKLQLEKAKRYHATFSLIMLDIDNFKNYNDNNGHLKGSEALRQVAELMRSVFRSSDILAKYGGDEFVIILPNSDKVGSFLAADRMREMVEAEYFDGQELQPMGNITLSLGLSSYPDHGQTVEELLDHADKALYAAKNTGRNKSVIYSEDMVENN